MSGLYNLAAAFGERVKTNLGGSFSQMSAQQWIRLVTVVCTYLLLRPYLLKLATRVQTNQMESEDAQAEANAAQERARVSPNEFRGQRVEIPEDSDSEDDQGGSKTGADTAQWGKKARRRQRAVVRKMLEDHEKKLADAAGDEEDRDIQEFLVD